MLGPIFNREWLTVPRHFRHYRLRIFYLGTLWVLGLTAWQSLLGWGRAVSQGDLAAFGSLLFQLFTFSQLSLVLFFAALIAAGAVAQEKDRRTFILLLITDMRHREIVLGKLLGSLLQTSVLLFASAPLLAFTVLLGGVAFHQVWEALAILAGTALAAGALGCLIALWRDKTYQTLALTLLGMVLYFLVVESLGLLPLLTGVDSSTIEQWQGWFNPYRALSSVLLPPVHQDFNMQPIFFTAMMFGLFVLLSGVGILKLRDWNPSGEPIQKPDTEETEGEGKAKRDIHAAPGKVRDVWPNPILWREIATRAYGRRTLLIKLIFLLIVVALSYSALVGLSSPERTDRLAPAFGMVPVLILSLLMINAQAVTSITNERDLNALELLLVTDLTPKEFLFGKLGGILFNTKEIILAPVVLALIYAWKGYCGVENTFYLVITMLVLMAFTIMLGIHVALRTVKARLAILYSIGTVFFLTVGTMLTIYLIIIGGQFEYQWTSFILFLGIGIGGLWLVLGGREPSVAISVASWACPLGMFYGITSVIIGNPRTGASGDVLWPFLVVIGSFGFGIAAMMVPMLSEFNVALAHNAPAEE